jgi:hypothetical protein
MDNTLQGYKQTEGHSKCAPLVKRIAWGFLGGLAGTMVMDILLMAVLLALGQPAFMCFSIVGDTVSQFLATFGTNIADGIPTGVVVHYVVGPLVGMLFGAGVTIFPVLRAGSWKKTAIAAIVYVEILSQPIVAMTPILLQMKTSDTLLWFGGSFVMHLIFGIILGVFVGHGLRSASRATQMNMNEESRQITL